MRTHSAWLIRTALAVFWVSVVLPLSSCDIIRAVTRSDSQTMMAAVRAYRGSVEKTAPQAEEQAKFPPADSLETENAYNLRISALLEQENFEQLDREAHEARVNKTRVAGGTWKIYDFYGDLFVWAWGSSSEANYETSIIKIKKWIAMRPQSATARIALASTYLGYAWLARGDGYANSITNEQWRLFYQRIELSKAPLLEAARLDEKCPYWYSMAMQLALDEGWSKAEAREIVDESNLFEPTYYHVYRQYGNYLLPQWYGQEGDTQAFTEEIANRLGEHEGSIVYYELASLVACQCDKEHDSLHGMSWPRIKSGFHDLVQRYGTSSIKTNRFAYIAYLAADKSSARDALALIGSDWVRDVWYSAGKFVSAMAWASAP